MAKYIDRDQFIDWLKTEIKFKDLSDGLGICLVIMKEDFERAIKYMPDSIIKDVAPVKHGHWILGTGENALQKGYRMCSQCGEIVKYAYTFYGEHNFCNYCGAKMDEEYK